MIEPRELVKRYRAGTCTEAERRYVEAWLLRYRASDDTGLDEKDYQRIRHANWQAVRAQTISGGRHAKRRWLPFAAAAAILALAIGTWLLIDGTRGVSDMRLGTTEILPGGNRATLTLADGRIITLDEAQTGIVIGNRDITYQDGSALAGVIPSEAGESLRNGRAPSHAQADVQMMLSLSTPKGGTYQVTLPDGSKVWLNAASTLRYPIRFTDAVREVFLEGEAFFEIKGIEGTRMSRVPFNVQTSGQTIEVLGTQFNVSAYTDDPDTKTTLVTGRVKVGMSTLRNDVPTSQEVRERLVELSPGQQATTRGAAITVEEVDLSSYTAWKDGLFLFDDEPLDAIMRKISRWYDVEVVFNDGIDRQERFGGGVSRYGKLKEVLDRLSLTGKVRFAVTERRITVMP